MWSHRSQAASRSNPAVKRGSGCAVLCLSVLLCACDSSGEPVPAVPVGQLNNALPSEAVRTTALSWGSALLGLIPERGDPSTPSLVRVRKAFEACISTGQAAQDARCDLRGPSRAAGDGPTVAVKIDPSGAEARVVRLSACCSSDTDFFQPFRTEPVILTELICSELTFVASETVKAFRVTSPGKRDFVYAIGSRSTPAGRHVEMSMWLSPLEPGDECSSLAGAHGNSAG